MPGAVKKARAWGKAAQQDRSSRRRVALLRRAGLFDPDTQGATITRATTLEDLTSAYRLVHDVFVRQGYIHPDETGIRIRVFEAMPETATFIAKADGQVVGVTSVIMDSPELGLPTDKAFAAELDALRAQGRRICEGTNWLVADSHRNSAVMAELMRCSFAHALAVGCTDFIGTVSPGHAQFYVVLGFEQISEVRSYSREIDDPVVVVRFDLTGLSEVLAAIDEGGDEAEAFLKKYYVDDNPYQDSVRAWEGQSQALFRDPAALRELFVNRGNLLGRCSVDQLDAIRQRWGQRMFAEVCGARKTAAFAGRPRWRTQGRPADEAR
jgi:hypothetical protein